ncbi:Cytoplasmic 60S subunit biogenesis factor [Gracilariopsis chorda]|uniref:Cytoplasmic 60S subunit biogenesis factor n=1 Tax=Gracilariopsis chorda TaxID=448386 RepID=A0A2V3J532_9FLOR|nr:Cytoplasmic 60S subunit biogenesis factor [Gracilariopsis chorda]|eukprot:PXF49107.1 Cytoplasmic 60S subunit biogenesis factor [Gracilariopsis chorda]
MDGSHSVRCTSCNVLVTGAEALRTHYRSDIHLVNVKRRVSGLAGLSVEEFTRRVQALQAAKSEQQKGKRGVSCDVCQKRFASEKALQNHEMSRRHREKVRSMNHDGSEWMSSIHSASEIADEEVVDVMDGEDEQVEHTLQERMAEWGTHDGFGGVFDNVWFESAEEALEHLQGCGVFVAFHERLRDVEGLMRYLSQKVGVGFACIECDRVFRSSQAARKHMRDVGHCGMTDDDEAWMVEFGEFYDWSGGAKREEDEEEGWEEVENEEELGDMAGVVVVREQKASESAMPILALEKGEEDGRDEVGLVVGDKVVGHRSLARYYRQRARGVEESAAVVAVRQERRMMELSRRAKDGTLPLRVRRLAALRESRFALAVGRGNYYSRKARFKQRMVVLNSGYRA